MIELNASRSISSKTGIAVLLMSLAACGADSGDDSANANAANDGGPANAGNDGGPANAGSDGGTGGDGADGQAASTDVPGSPVNLGTAGTYVILAKSGVSTVTTSAVTGDIAVSPAAASYITGFSLKMDATNVFSTSAQDTGKVYAADYMPPTPIALTTAVNDMQTAFTHAAARAPNVTELGAGNIGGKTLAPGVYKWGTGLLIPTDVTLAGNATDVWVFQIAQNLTIGSAAKVVLSGGAMAKNVFWQVAGLVDLGTTAHCEGIIMSQTGISLETGASINGRLFAQTAVTIAGSAVVQPAP